MPKCKNCQDDILEMEASEHNGLCEYCYIEQVEKEKAEQHQNFVDWELERERSFRGSL